VETFALNTTLLGIGKQLRRGKFDLALVLPNSPRAALEVWFAGIPRRVGYAQPWRNFFLTDAIPPRPGAVVMHKRSNAEINQLVEHAVPISRPSPGCGARSQVRTAAAEVDGSGGSGGEIHC
jgi:ADP-heptose:LPS heptosyltransferase